jgi:hypothetical protein
MWRAPPVSSRRWSWHSPGCTSCARRCRTAWTLPPELAADPLDRLSEIARASGSDWALGIEAHSRALMSEGEAAERLYLEAIERLGRTRIRVELARSHLLYGEWLRRERWHLNAREQLRTAYELFTRMGAEAFAGRARHQLAQPALPRPARRRGRRPAQLAS